jgi:preprotein translocase subunit SecF
MRILSNVNIDWLRWRWHALALSWLVILSGVFFVSTRGVPLGIDFSGGTLVVVRFAQPVGEESVRGALAGLPGDKAVQQYGDAGSNEILIRMPVADEEAREGNVAQMGARIAESLRQANIGTFELRSTEEVGPVIGRDLVDAGDHGLHRLPLSSELWRGRLCRQHA